MRALGILAAALALLLPVTAAAQAPAQMPVQGYLTDSEGVPVEGGTSLTFRIFDTDVGGTALFTETQSVMVDSGYFTAYLGDVSVLDLATFRDNGSLYVEVEIEGEPLSPRIQLGTVPYAGFAEYAGTAGDATSLGGMSASDFAPASHGHPWGDITGVPGDLSDGDDDTTYSAGTGLSLSGTTFSANTSYLQRRVSGTCPAGQSIRAISSTGSVTCEVDDGGSTYSAGSGLSLSGTTFSIATGGVTASHLAANSVGASEIASSAVRSSEIATNAVGSSEIATNAVGSSEIAANAVGMSELDLPSGVDDTSTTLATGANYLMVSAFTPPASGTCLVISQLQVNTSASDTYTGAFVRTARQVGAGSPSLDPEYGHYAVPAGSYSVDVTVSYDWSVTGGTSYRFGCYVSAGGDYVGRTAYCRVTWLCQ